MKELLGGKGANLAEMTNLVLASIFRILSLTGYEIYRDKIYFLLIKSFIIKVITISTQKVYLIKIKTMGNLVYVCERN
jgi:hypothetical protein